MKARPLTVALLLVGFLLVGFSMRHATQPMVSGDCGTYLKMAESPGTFVAPPWGYRIGIPYTAALLSDVADIPLQTVFEILQIGMFAVFAVLLFVWVSKELGRGAFTAGLAVLLFVFSFPGVYNIRNVIQVGFAEYVLILVGCIAIYGSRFPLLCLVVGASAVVKESVGFLLIPSFFLTTVRFDRSRTAWVRSAVIIAIFLLPFLLLRSGIFFRNHGDIGTYTSFYTWEYVAFVYNYWGGITRATALIALTFGPLCLISAVGFLFAPPRLKALVVIPVLATLQIVLATDVLRMFAVGIPVLIGLAAFALSKLDRRHAGLLASVPCVQFLCLNRGLHIIPVSVAALVLTLALLWFSRSQLLCEMERSGATLVVTKMFNRLHRRCRFGGRSSRSGRCLS